MHRILDVLFQHLRSVVLCLVAIPLVVGAGSWWFDGPGPDVVSARLRVDPADFAGDALSEVFAPATTPADSLAALIGQLVGTDWFSVPVVARADASEHGQRSSIDHRADLEDLRTHLRTTAEGARVLSLRYPSAAPERGIRLIDALLAGLGDAVRTVESQRASSALRVISADLDRARADMQRSIDEATGYPYRSGLSGDDLQTDRTYRHLTEAAKAATDHYQRLDDRSRQARTVADTVPGLPHQAFAVIDAPAATSGSRVPQAVRRALLGLAGTAAIAGLVLYVIALRDPRVRALEDINRLFPEAWVLGVPPQGRWPRV